MTTDKSILARIMAYRKVLAETESEISTLKAQNPKLFNREEINNLKDKFREKRAEYDKIREELEKIDNQISTLEHNKSERVNQDRTRLYELVRFYKNQYEQTENELNRIIDDLEISSTSACQKYIKALNDREILKNKLASLEQTVDINSLEQITNIQATEQKSTPFGPVLITKNLFTNLNKFTNWQKEFSARNKLEILTDEKNSGITFISTEQNIQIEVSKEKISGAWNKDCEPAAISLLVEIYLKSIENEKVDKHQVEGKTSDITQQIEMELAKQLNAKGLKNANINDKELDAILNTKFAHEKTADADDAYPLMSI